MAVGLEQNVPTSTDDFVNGVWKRNPVFVQVLGMCPVLAVSNTAMNALAMGLATSFVLLMSNTVVSSLRRVVPQQVRIVTYILIIATFVTIVDYVIQAISLELHKALGAFISLIVVNCLILGRAEAFASQNGVRRSILDALGHGTRIYLGTALFGRRPRAVGRGQPVRCADFWRAVSGVDRDDAAARRILHAGGMVVAVQLAWPAACSQRNDLGVDSMNDESLWSIFINACLVNNFVLAYFLGICPFLGVSGKLDTAVRMGGAVTFVMVVSSMAAFGIQSVLMMVDAPYLKLISFIAVIASTVQLVEMFIKKVSPTLFRALGIFLPLITTNCAILAVALFQTNKGYGFLQSIVYASGAGIGFTLALVLMAGLREKLQLARTPDVVKGTVITLLLAGLLSICFMGFAGLFS